MSQVNVENEKRKSPLERDFHPKLSPPSTRILQSTTDESNLKTLSLPLLVRGRYFQALVDTGSSLPLIQESCWRQLGHKKQKFKLWSNFQASQWSSIICYGRWGCECELQRRYEVELFIMKEDDLTITMVLGMDFLVTSGINLAIGNALYTLPSP